MIRYISSLPDAARIAEQPRKLVVLGSTGSIGRSTLAVVRLQKDTFSIIGLAAGKNIALLAEQAAEFRPPYLAVLEQEAIEALKALLPDGYTPEILHGPQGYTDMAGLPETTFVLSAQVGAAGLAATMAGAEAGKIIALANKESLVLAGNLIRTACAQSGACILPVDSEHNALFQAMAGGFNCESDGCPSAPDVSRLILTASGGPFYGYDAAQLRRVTVSQALEHPNWNMGRKVTIDSSTLMNKGLELIEASHLFGIPITSIDVVIHKGSIVHSLVEYADGSQIAQLGTPDMRIPIAHCLGWPRRLHTGVDRLSLAEEPDLTFEYPDEAVFPCLALAKRAQTYGRGSPIVLNATNEVAVDAFLKERISYLDIASMVQESLDLYECGCIPGYMHPREPDNLDAVMALDTQARATASALLQVFSPH